MQDDRVEIAVARGVAAAAGVGLADAAGAVDEHLVETAAAGLAGVLVAQVPLAEDAGGVAGAFEGLGQGEGLQAHPLAFVDGVGDAGAELVPAGHDGAAGRRAGRADVEVLETEGLVVEAVQIRRADHGIAVTAEVTVALVVGEDQDDVGSPAGEFLGSGRVGSGRGSGPDRRDTGRGRDAMRRGHVRPPVGRRRRPAAQDRTSTKRPGSTSMNRSLGACEPSSFQEPSGSRMISRRGGSFSSMTIRSAATWMSIRAP